MYERSFLINQSWNNAPAVATVVDAALRTKKSPPQREMNGNQGVP